MQTVTIPTSWRNDAPPAPRRLSTEELAAAEVFHRVAVAERNFERAVCDRLRAEREEYRRLLVEARESVALELGNMNVRLQRSMSSASLHERDEVAGLLSAIDAALAAKGE